MYAGMAPKTVASTAAMMTAMAMPAAPPLLRRAGSAPDGLPGEGAGEPAAWEVVVAPAVLTDGCTVLAETPLMSAM